MYLAFDTVLEREVALKVPHAHCFTTRVDRERFYREGRAAARLRHPNLCPVLDFGQHEGIHFITMPHIDGVRLLQRRVDEPLAAVRLVVTLARAMSFAHRLHVIHRDLKPDNVLITPDGAPVVTDFGLALRLDVDPHVTEPGAIVGTLPYLSPEQVRAEQDAIGPAADIYALGVILFWLFTGRLPFVHEEQVALVMLIYEAEPPRPALFRPDLDPRLEAVCLRALAKRPMDRYPSMDHLADALEGCLHPRAKAIGQRPSVARGCGRCVFVGVGERAPTLPAGQDRLFLDVGNDLHPGVIDHHQLIAGTGSTTHLVLDYPAFIDASVNPHRHLDDPFTFVLHEEPDLDAVASMYLARSYLEDRQFPAAANELASYVDEVDAGVRGLNQANPFDLYAMYIQMTNRLLGASWNSHPEHWRERVEAGERLVRFALAEAARLKRPLRDIDVSASPEIAAVDRAAITEDLQRYRMKVADPRSHSQIAKLSLPGRFGEQVEVDALSVRDVQNVDDPQRCRFFKDWARSDGAYSPAGRGFAALVVFCSEGPGRPRRCIISVDPSSDATLHGLGALLEAAETERRRSVFGVDDRTHELTTGTTKIPRPGYGNSDPWYDGRAHAYTIVDSPHSGTLLTADEIEDLFWRFGDFDQVPKAME